MYTVSGVTQRVGCVMAVISIMPNGADTDSLSYHCRGNRRTMCGGLLHF